MKPGPLHGAIDRIAFPWTIKGWAHDKAHPELPVTLEVVLDGAVIGAIVACDYRADLHAANLGQGRCSFAWRSPVRLPADAADRLTIRRATDRAPIPMTPDCKAASPPTRVRPKRSGGACDWWREAGRCPIMRKGSHFIHGLRRSELR